MKRLTPREGYDLYAQDYRKDHPHLDSFMDGAETESWGSALDALIERLPRVTAMDVGCGDGRTLGRWKRRVENRGWSERVELWGSDISPRMIEAARGRVKGVRWDVLDLADPVAVARWTEAHGRVDLVSAFFVVVHFDQSSDFFTGVTSLLAPGGRLVMNTIPQPSAPELRASGKPIVIEAWDHRAEDVIKAGLAAGLGLVESRDFHDRGEVISTLLDWRFP